LIDLGGVGALETFLVVADVPLDQYSEAAINRNISNLDWLSRAAVAHESVVESFVAADAVLPMKIFTIFASDARAVRYVGARRKSILALLNRVRQQAEWGVRVVLDPAREAVRAASRSSGRAAAGTSYLALKKAERDALAGAARRGRGAARRAYDRLRGHATSARRREVAGTPAAAGALVLDAVFLVRRSRAPRFRSAVARLARELEPRGFTVSLTGPWPPYSFLRAR
jgi:hypothetical protein